LVKFFNDAVPTTEVTQRIMKWKDNYES